MALHTPNAEASRILLDDQKASGLSVRAYCRLYGLTPVDLGLAMPSPSIFPVVSLDRLADDDDADEDYLGHRE